MRRDHKSHTIQVPNFHDIWNIDETKKTPTYLLICTYNFVTFPSIYFGSSVMFVQVRVFESAEFVQPEALSEFVLWLGATRTNSNVAIVKRPAIAMIYFQPIHCGVKCDQSANCKTFQREISKYKGTSEHVICLSSVHTRASLKIVLKTKCGI